MAGFCARNFIIGLIATALTASAAFAADPPAAQPDAQPALSPQKMMDKINALEAEVHQMKSQQVQDEQILQAKRDEDVKAVLDDARLHSQLLGGINAGYANRRFYIQSDDGNFVFRPWVHLQVRESTAWRVDAKGGGNADDTQNGFEIRRARFGFDGNMFSKNITYFINWATNRENSTLTVKDSTGKTVGTTTSPVGGLPVLEEAWLKARVSDDSPFYIKAGQIHDPFDHENIVGSKYRAPEASIQGDVFGNTDTFTQGATLIYDNQGFARIEGGVTDGIRAANTNFEDSPNLGINYDGGVAARAEFKLFGNWKDYDQLTAYGDKSDLMVLGVGVDDSWGGNFNSLSHVFDLQYANTDGIMVYAAYLGRFTHNNPGIPNGGSVSTSFASTADFGDDTYEPSVDILVSDLIDGKLEPFVRYEYMHLAGTPVGSNNNVTDVSLGANYYFYGHNLKFTGMVTYLPTGIPVNDDSGDVLISNNHSEIVVVAQIQLLL